VIALAADDTFVKPHIAYGSLWPILVVFGAACVGVLIEAFLPRQWRYLAQFGTMEIRRAEYLRQLGRALKREAVF